MTKEYVSDFTGADCTSFDLEEETFVLHELKPKKINNEIETKIETDAFDILFFFTK